MGLKERSAKIHSNNYCHLLNANYMLLSTQQYKLKRCILYMKILQNQKHIDENPIQSNEV